MFKQIDIAEVKKHSSEKSAWIIIHNEIYDVTPFLKEHPGGEDSLMDFAGKDGTQAFEDVGHSEDAREMMKKLKIGFLPAKERSTFFDKWRQTMSSKSCSKDIEVKKIEKHAPSSIIVPRESSNLKWCILALAMAIVVGISIKKYTAA